MTLVQLAGQAGIECDFNIHDACRVRLRTNDERFAHYAPAFLPGFTKPTADSTPDVDSVYLNREWGDVIGEVRGPAAELVNENAWLDGGRLVTARRGTLYVAEHDSGQFTLTGLFKEPRILQYMNRVPRRWSRRFGMWESETREEYHLQTVRDLLHFPIFAVLRKRGFTILHGSCVAKDGRAICIFGYNRVGKSSVALDLMVHHGWNPVADNFILTDGERIYAFPERLRYSEATLNLVGKTGLSVAGKSPCWGKFHFDLPELAREVAMVSMPALNVYLHRGDGAAELRSITADDAAHRMGAMNSFLHEFDNYSFLNLLPGFYSFEDPTLLKQYFSRAPVYECRGAARIGDTAEAILRALP